MRFSFFVALKYLRAKRRQAVISIITFISVIGVTAGVAALVIALAVNNGFREELEQKLLGATANINLIRSQNDGIRNYEALTEKLAKEPHVVAAAPALYEEVLVSSHQRAQGIILKGVDPAREVKVGDLLRRLKEGSLDGLTDRRRNAAAQDQTERRSQTGATADGATADEDPIIIGKELAKSLGAFVGDTLLVTSPQGYLTPFEVVPKYRHFRVVGVFDSGFYDFDATWAFTTLDAAQRLFDLKGTVSVIEFKIDDIYRAPEMAEALKTQAGKGFDTTTWMEQNKSLFSALSLERLVTILTIGLIVLVAALNIFITLAMMVMEKNRDIAVLMSMGAKERQIWSVFTLHGVLIGALGTFAGLVLGYGISWLGGRFKLIPLQADVYSLAAVPFHARPWDGVWIAAAALVISFIATLYPAVSAARLNPVEILRYE